MSSTDPTSRADEVVAALDPEQREVALALTGPVCVLAGAGTGKTRAITHRIAYGVHAGVYRPQSVLAVTFTARAAGEMRGRLRTLGVVGVQARTFHAAALRQLRYFWPRVVGGELPRLTERKVPLLAEAAGRLRLAPGPIDLRDLAAEVEWAKVTRTAPEDYAAAAHTAGRTPPAGLDPSSMGRLFAGYEEAKRAAGRIDFEDVLLLTVAALEERPDVAAEVRSAYRHFVVDEYQDVNPLQQRLLELWLGDSRELCVVGDASQTIYSFTGASSSYLVDFARRWPEATVVRLVRDYRSTPQVVELANKVLGGARGANAGARLELVAQRGPGPAPVVVGHADEAAEAAAVAAAARALVHQGVPAAEIAVLFRINAQSEAYEEALTEVGVPYVLRGGERFFERPEVKQAVLLLRGAARSGELAAGDLAAEVRDVLASTGWDPRQPPAGGGAARERWQSLAALVDLAETYGAEQPEPSLAGLVAELDERAAAQHAPTVDGVTLASLHAAKGLEWEAVFVVGLVEGMLPIVHAQTAESVEEERRLLYVGITRAREHLSLSWAWARNPGGARTREPSRFLDGLRTADPVAPGGGRPASRRGGGRGRLDRTCRSCGRPLSDPAQRKRGRCADCPPVYDEDLYERLRAWRLDRARADAVPAFVVFTDATLEAIAVQRPSSRAEMSRISGVGSAKLERYAEPVLALVAGDVPAADKDTDG